MTLCFPSDFIPSRTVVLAIVSTILATLKISVDDDDDRRGDRSFSVVSPRVSTSLTTGH